jgi:hypothetical protein
MNNLDLSANASNNEHAKSLYFKCIFYNKQNISRCAKVVYILYVRICSSISARDVFFEFEKSSKQTQLNFLILSIFYKLQNPIISLIPFAIYSNLQTSYSAFKYENQSNY